MKGIYLIFIVACLAEQLKANVYFVRPIEVIRVDRIDVYVDPDFEYGGPRITFFDSFNQANMKINILISDLTFNNMIEFTLNDPCNMDRSTENGTLAAMFWGSLGIDSCPIETGDYTVAHKFNHTGIIETLSEEVKGKCNIYFELLSEGRKKDKTLFHIYTEVQLVEETT